MKQITVHSKIYPDTFTKFSRINAYKKNKIWKNPLLFMIIMLAFATVCYINVGKREGALLLGIVLTIVGLLLPVVYIFQFENSIKKQSKIMRLEKGREAYALILSDDGVMIKSGADAKRDVMQKCTWDDFKEVWRKDNDMYLYANKGNAYILADQKEEVWDALTSHIKNIHVVK